MSPHNHLKESYLLAEHYRETGITMAKRFLLFPIDATAAALIFIRHKISPKNSALKERLLKKTPSQNENHFSFDRQSIRKKIELLISIPIVLGAFPWLLIASAGLVSCIGNKFEIKRNFDSEMAEKIKEYLSLYQKACEEFGISKENHLFRGMKGPNINYALLKKYPLAEKNPFLNTLAHLNDFEELKEESLSRTLESQMKEDNPQYPFPGRPGYYPTLDMKLQKPPVRTPLYRQNGNLTTL